MGAIENLQLLADVDTQPNVEEALANVLAARRQRHERRNRQFTVSFISLIAAIAITAIPPVRIAAHDVYAELAIHMLGVTPHLSANLPQELLLPNVFPIGPATPSLAVPFVEAQAFVPFKIQLPETALLPYQPRFFIHGPTTLNRRIDSASIKIALQRLGRDPVEVPAGLDGATISITFHKTVTLRLGECPELVGPWHSCAFLTEALAPTISLPQGMKPETLMIFSLQLLGLGASDARALSRTGGILFPPENYASHKVVDVNSHEGVLVVYQPGSTGEVAYNLSWTANGIAYSLFGRDPSTALTVAGSLR